MRFKGELFDVSTIPTKTLKKVRVIVVVGVKVSKKAVVRNKIKRQVREIIRLYPSNFSEMDLKVVVFGKAVGKKYDLLKIDLEKGLKTVLW